MWKAKPTSAGGTSIENSLVRAATGTGVEPQIADTAPGKSFRNFRFDTTSIIQAMEAVFSAN